MACPCLGLTVRCCVVVAAVAWAGALPTRAQTAPPGRATASSWPGFRGVGDSRTEAVDLPLEWGPGKNIAWAVDLPGVGQSGPVVIAGKVFATAVSGANKETLHLVCLDSATGKTLWTREHAAAQKAQDTDYVSKAAPTPCVDRERVYAFFESGDLLACDHDGKPVWSRCLTAEYGEFTNNHGLGSSFVQSAEALFAVVAQGEKSYVIALDKKTGKNLWKLDQAIPASWTSPTVVDHEGKPQLVISSSGIVVALDAATGKPLWGVEGLKGNTVASPSIAGGLAIIGSSEPGGCLAIRLGGGGDVSGTHVAWRSEAASCSFGSPLVHKGRAYFVNRAGAVYCLEAATGRSAWTARASASAWASPLGAGDRVYVFTVNGTCDVFSAGGRGDKLAENSLESKDRIYGAAAVNGAFVIRQTRKLTCVGRPK
jgi:outer membrane protein assembly factor BamB